MLHSGSVSLQLSRETSLRCSVPFPSVLPPLTSCLFQSVKEINQLSVGQARTCKVWKVHSTEPEHFWGGCWRRLDWTGRSSLSPTAASRTSRGLCVEGEDWESLAWLRASALLCLLIHCTFLEALAAACPSWRACAGNLDMAVAQLCLGCAPRPLFLLQAETLQVQVRIVLVCDRPRHWQMRKICFLIELIVPSLQTLLF